MANRNRRALIAGINPAENIDPDLAEAFIEGRKPRRTPKPSTPLTKSKPPAENVTPAEPQARPLPSVTAQPEAAPFIGVSRVPVGARVRTDLATALKRASLERQLKGLQPNSVQDILEEAIDLWLLKNGHAR